MLLQRVLTALVLIPLVFGGVLYLPDIWFAVLFGLIVLAGAYEWARLSGFEEVSTRILFIGTIGGCLAVAYLWLLEPGALWIAGIASCWWLWISLTIMSGRTNGIGSGSPISRALLGLITLLPVWVSLIYLRQSNQDGPWLVLFLLTLIWVADSAAYFVGRRWGRIKLAPTISPGKSREGVYGAIAGSILWGGLLIVLRPEIANPILIVLLCIGVCLVSVVGDLFESLLKRRAGMKDSGAILPGHGGVLDRIDSLTAAAPVFLSGLSLLRWIG